jgi:hypothetical protein
VAKGGEESDDEREEEEKEGEGEEEGETESEGLVKRSATEVAMGFLLSQPFFVFLSLHGVQQFIL